MPEQEEYIVTQRPSRRPTHPGEILREDVLPTLNISVSEAARQLLISRQTLHRILNCSHSITPDMAVRLGKFCGNGPGLWIRMQSDYDIWIAQDRLREELASIPSHQSPQAA